MADTPHPLFSTLSRIADALERMAPPPAPVNHLHAADAFVWRADRFWLEPVGEVNRIELPLLKGLERQRDELLANTLRFSNGYPANNALLWGARGTGKSSLVKAVHAEVNERLRHENPKTSGLALVEIHREDVNTLPRLLGVLRKADRAFILFCDDLSFDGGDDAYKSLKAVLEGGIEGRPNNVIFYATSNRRHLLSRQMIENEQSSAIHGGEAVEEKVSLSDRFGLWLGFHAIDQDTYFEIVKGYAGLFGLNPEAHDLLAAALEWSMTRGARSGRVAWQFILDYAGKHGAIKPVAMPRAQVDPA